MTLDTRLAALRNAPLFQDVEHEAVSDLALAGSERLAPQGGDLFTQGEAPTHLHVIMEGQVKVWRTNTAGAPLIVDILGPGALVGCAAVFRQFPYPATATALTPVVTVALPAPKVLDALKRYPQMALNALSAMSAQMETMVRRLQDAAVESVERRVARTLLRLHERASGEGPVVLNVTRQTLAELSATTLHTVSRLLSAWSRAGWVQSGRERVVLVDETALRTLAAAD